eukprot:m.80205 g.80205  ORF g.80205 m.80205 type:complete len:323 (+) comp8620_c0_seq7:3-971(+)
MMGDYLLFLLSLQLLILFLFHHYFEAVMEEETQGLTQSFVVENKWRCFKGWQKHITHWSKALQCKMNLHIFLPDAIEETPVHVIYFLPGLTRTHETAALQGNTQRFLSEHGIMMVYCDTSPRNVLVNENVTSETYGPGAGMYVDAAVMPWKTNYNMFTYVSDELPSFIEQNFNVTERRSLIGHSMGGHGALLCAIKSKKSYASTSVFGSLCSISKSPVSKVAMTQYFGENVNTWKEWDVNELVGGCCKSLNLLVSQGGKDEYLVPEDQLFVEEFVERAKENNAIDLQYEYHEEFGHGYFFLSTFIEQHISFHKYHLTKSDED